MHRHVTSLLIVAIATALIGLGSATTHADGLDVRSTGGSAAGDFLVSCENGRVYPFRPRGVNPEGDLVTGYLYTAPRRAVHMRLIPLGLGYRYAGHGIWLEGVRDEAVLSFGKAHSVACTVSRG
jgi:hypothetical protein